MTAPLDLSRALTPLLMLASVMALGGVILAAILAWRLVDLRAQVEAERRECRCCDAPRSRS